MPFSERAAEKLSVSVSYSLLWSRVVFAGARQKRARRWEVEAGLLCHHNVNLELKNYSNVTLFQHRTVGIQLSGMAVEEEGADTGLACLQS